ATLARGSERLGECRAPRLPARRDAGATRRRIVAAVVPAAAELRARMARGDVHLWRDTGGQGEHRAGPAPAVAGSCDGNHEAAAGLRRRGLVRALPARSPDAYRAAAGSAVRAVAAVGPARDRRCGDGLDVRGNPEA